jgi:hypothetical protein
MAIIGGSLAKEHFCKAAFHFGQIGSKRRLQIWKTTDVNDEKCRRDANLMKEVERVHFVTSFFHRKGLFQIVILGVDPKFNMSAMGNLFQK